MQSLGRRRHRFLCGNGLRPGLLMSCRVRIERSFFHSRSIPLYHHQAKEARGVSRRLCFALVNFRRRHRARSGGGLRRRLCGKRVLIPQRKYFRNRSLLWFHHRARVAVESSQHLLKGEASISLRSLAKRLGWCRHRARYTSSLRHSYCKNRSFPIQNFFLNRSIPLDQHRETQARCLQRRPLP